jgi:AmmeMemoRadiSam system protein B
MVGYTGTKESDMDNEGTPIVRKAWYAGTWYAAEPDVLRSTIEAAIHAAQAVGSQQDTRGPVALAVLPHAGLAYSARGLGHLVCNAPKPIKRVVILSPSHNIVLPDDTLSFGTFSGYDTPLGRLSAFRTGLETHGPDATNAIQREHAVEMVLPFLAYLQKRQTEPIAVSMALVSHVSDATHAKRLAASLVEVLGADTLQRGETLVVASSDFTHYGHRFGHAPFGAHVDAGVAAKVREADLKLAKELANGELGPLFLTQRMGRSTVCGIAAASIVSAMGVQLEQSGWVADYYTSLDVLGTKAIEFVAYCTILWRVV